MKRTLAIAAVAVALVVAVPHGASAEVADVGFYTRNPAASAPAGGFQVSNAPDGVVSYGAVLASEDGESITKAVLTLKESGQQVSNASAALQVCPAVGTFKSGRGTLAEGPKADCLAMKVEIKRNPDATWEADVTSLVAGAERPAVAVVPVSGVFQVSFGPPELTVETEESGSSGAGLGSDFDASEFGGTADGGGSSSGSSGGSSSDFGGSSDSGSSSDFGDSSSSGGTSFDAGGSGSSFGGGSSGFGAGDVAAPTAAPASPASSLAEPELAAAPAVDAELPTRRRLSATTASATSDGGTWGQFLFFVVAAGVIGAGAGIARNRLVTSRAT